MGEWWLVGGGGGEGGGGGGGAGKTLTMALPAVDQPTYCSCLSSMWPFTLNSSLNTQKHTGTLNTTTTCTTLSPLSSPSFFHLFRQTNTYAAH